MCQTVKTYADEEPPFSEGAVHCPTMRCAQVKLKAVPAALATGHLCYAAQMITLTRVSEPESKSYLFTIDRDGEVSLRLTRAGAIARLTMLDVEGAERLVDQAARYGVIIIHVHG